MKLNISIWSTKSFLIFLCLITIIYFVAYSNSEIFKNDVTNLIDDDEYISEGESNILISDHEIDDEDIYTNVNKMNTRENSNNSLPAGNDTLISYNRKQTEETTDDVYNGSLVNKGNITKVIVNNPDVGNITNLDAQSENSGINNYYFVPEDYSLGEVSDNNTMISGEGNSEYIRYYCHTDIKEVIFDKASGFDTVRLSDSVFTREQGKPEIPIKVLNFAVEKDASIDFVEIIRDNRLELDGEYLLSASSEAVKVNEENHIEYPDYSDIQIYPANIVEIAARSRCFGVDIVTVHLYPVQYIPYERKLILNTDVEFILRKRALNEGLNNGAMLTDINSDGRIDIKKSVCWNETAGETLKSIIANPDDLNISCKPATNKSNCIGLDGISALGQPAIEGTSEISIDYLIITNRVFLESRVFDPLIGSKFMRGLNVLIESVENIVKNTEGSDTPEKIRNFIKDKRENNDLVWVLLGGDVDIVPTRYVLGGTSGIISASDMYYSDLDGDWDGNDNGIYGEMSDCLDLGPDVLVGRLPFSEIMDANNYIMKLYRYEQGMIDPEYLKNVLLLGSSEYEDAGGRSNDLIHERYISDPYYNVTKLYERDMQSYRDETIRAINNGQHIINHIDIGGALFLCLGDDFITQWDIDNLENFDTPAIMCSSGSFTADISRDCIGRHWLTGSMGGGIGFIGSSGPAFHPHSDKMLGPSFYEELFINRIQHISGALAESKTKYIGLSRIDPIMSHTVLRLSLLGDPELRVKLNDICTDPCVIMSPEEDAVLSGVFDIRGNAFHADSFLSYSVDIISNDTGLCVFNFESPSPVTNDILAQCPPDGFDDGSYRIDLTVLFSAGTLKDSINITMENNPENIPPGFINLRDIYAVVGRTLIMDINADDPDTPNASLIFDADSDADIFDRGATFDSDTRSFIWRPDQYDRGIYEVTFSVSDGVSDVVCKTISIETVSIDIYGLPVDPDVSKFTGNIHGNYAVWQENASPQYGIYAYDIANDKIIPISEGAWRKGTPFIHDDKVVWHDNREGNYDIHLYDLTNRRYVRLTEEDSSQRYPRIYDNRIVWVDERGGNKDIYTCLYDINKVSAVEIEALTSDDSYQYAPDIDGVNVVWADGSLEGDVYAYDLNLDYTKLISESNGVNIKPNVQGDFMVWEKEQGAGNIDIYISDINGVSVEQITQDANMQKDPDIFDDIVIWNDIRNESSHIYMKNLDNGNVLKVTQDQMSECPASIDGNNILFQEGNRIFLAQYYFYPVLKRLIETCLYQGEELTLIGNNFGWGNRSQVMFGDVPATDIVIWTDDFIKVVIPEDAPPVSDCAVQVVTPGGYSAALTMEVILNDPIIDSVMPNSCVLRESTIVTINGSNFFEPPNVLFDPRADFNDDGAVDFIDYLTWKWRAGTKTGATHGMGDADGDGDVDGYDLRLVNEYLSVQRGRSHVIFVDADENAHILDTISWDMDSGIIRCRLPFYVPVCSGVLHVVTPKGISEGIAMTVMPKQ